MPMRVYGAPVIRANLPNEVGNVPLRLIGTAAFIGNTSEVDIDAVNEGAQTSVYVPSQWSKVGHVILFFRGNVTNTVNIRYTIFHQKCTKENYGYDLVTAAVVTIDTKNVCLSIDLTVLAPDGSMNAPGSLYYIQVIYAAAGGAGIATDIDFLGAYITEA